MGGKASQRRQVSRRAWGKASRSWACGEFRRLAVVALRGGDCARLKQMGGSVQNAKAEHFPPNPPKFV